MRPQASGFVFAPGGHRLYMRDQSGSLLVFHIPNSPREPMHAPRIFTPDKGHVLVAVGRLQAGKRTVAVTQSTDALHLLFFDAKVQRPRGVRVALEGREFPRANGESPLSTLGVISHVAACFINSDGSLVKIINDTLDVVSRPPPAPSNAPFAIMNEATKALPEGLVFTTNSPGGEPHRRVKYVVGDHGCIRVEDCYEPYEPVGPAGPIFFGVRGIASSMVWRGTDGRWFFKPSRRPETVPPGVDVFGVIERGGPEPHLAVVDASRTSIGYFVDSAVHTIHKSDDRIAIAATSTAARHVAYLTESGELVVFSSDSGIVLLRVATQ